MTEEKVKKLLAENGLLYSDFILWMTGRTISEDEEGNAIYHLIDVARFFSDNGKHLEHKI